MSVPKRRSSPRKYASPYIVDAKHVDGYRVELRFDDGFLKIVDLANFMKSTRGDFERKYIEPAMFSKVWVSDGDLCWGESDILLSGRELRDSVDGSDIVKPEITPEYIRKAYKLGADVEDPFAWLEEKAKKRGRRNKEKPE